MKKFILAVCVVIFAFGVSSLFGQLAGAAPRQVECSKYITGKTVLLYPAWYRGINTCIRDESFPGKGVQVTITNISDIWIIALNLVQWLIITVGYVALYFVIWGGIKYITSRGDPAKITSAKGAITNAIIGLIIALVSVIIVRAVQGAINGTMT